MYDVSFRFRFRVGDGVFYYPLPHNKDAWKGWAHGRDQEYFVVHRQAFESVDSRGVSYRISRHPNNTDGSIPVAEEELVHSPGGAS